MAVKAPITAVASGNGHDKGNGGTTAIVGTAAMPVATETAMPMAIPPAKAPSDQSGASDNAGPGSTDTDTDVSDDSLSPHGLGKLNGFFHASPNGLAHASPNSSIGRISKTFGVALSAYAEAQEEQEQQTSDGTGTGDTSTTETTHPPVRPPRISVPFSPVRPTSR